MSYNAPLSIFVSLCVFNLYIGKCEDGLKFWRRDVKPATLKETKHHNTTLTLNITNANQTAEDEARRKIDVPLLQPVPSKQRVHKKPHERRHVWFTDAPEDYELEEHSHGDYSDFMPIRIINQGVGIEYTTQNEADYLNVNPVKQEMIKPNERSHLKPHKKTKKHTYGFTQGEIIEATKTTAKSSKEHKTHDKHKKEHRKHHKAKKDNVYEKDRNVMILDYKKKHVVNNIKHGESKGTRFINVNSGEDKEDQSDGITPNRVYADSEPEEKTTHEAPRQKNPKFNIRHRFKVKKSDVRHGKDDRGVREPHKKATRSHPKTTTETIKFEIEDSNKKSLRDSERSGEAKKAYIHKLPFVPKSERGKPIKVDLENFFSPYSIAKQLKCLQNQKGVGNIASIMQEIIGHTAEFNDIVLWKMKEHSDFIGDKENFRAKPDALKYEDDDEKKIIFIVHGLNTMGWQHLPCLSKVNEFKKLLSYYAENLDSFDIFLIPMANPDGVKQLKQNMLFNAFLRHDFQWNKNMSPQSECPGVVLDRNFDVGWNVSLIKLDSCSPLYPGPEPFSEHETKAIREIFHKYGNKMAAFIHVHGGTFDSSTFKGDAVLYPKGYTDLQLDDDRYVDLRGEIDEALRNASFKVATATVDTLYNWYGAVAGSSVDYASSVYGIPYALELVMQVYKDDFQVESQRTMDDLALTEMWQVILDVIFDHIYKTEVKPNEKCSKK